MGLRLNDLHPAPGARRSRKRRGRGIGSGLGKTAGRGHKGQKSRSGGGVKAGFEGGQMPLHRRLPKFGFRSRSARFVDEVRLHELARVAGDVADLQALKDAHVVASHVTHVRVIASGELRRPVTVRGLHVTRGARAAIEAAGGRIEE